MKAVMLVSQSISLGHRGVIVAGGSESMSNVPYLLPQARTGLRLGNGTVVDGIVHDGLWDVYNDHHMGICAEKCSRTYGIGREAQDKHAIESYERAALAWEKGKFDEETVAVEVPSKRRGAAPQTVTKDEEYTNIDLAKLSGLRPAFQKEGGTVTAANASSLNDGAAALVLMSPDRAQELGVRPLALIKGYGDAARLMDLDPARVNVNGGALALGHPIGMLGARIICSLYNVLKQNDGTMGCATICNGGGGASAVLIERLS